MIANIRNVMYSVKALMAVMGRMLKNLNGWRRGDIKDVKTV